MKMSVVFPKQPGLYVADNNAAQVLYNEERKLILMEFDLSGFPSAPLEAVVGWKEPETPTEKMARAYQHDADIFRLRHLGYYAELIEAYRLKTGRYPLQGEAPGPHYVLIAAPHQQQYAQGLPEQLEVTGLEAFRSVLEEGLQREVAFKFDPQKVPVGAP